MNILLATDGSEFSKEATRKCCELFKVDEDSKITIISAVEVMTPQEPFGTSDDYYIVATKAAHKTAEKIVQDARDDVEKILAEEKANIDIEIIDGNATQVIVEKSEEIGADVVVVGSHGRGFWGRVFLGSVSDAVTKHAPCSVLVVRKKLV